MYSINPLVSVIVITYNQEKFIKECLDSILKQEVDFTYEVLVGDDCSSDSTYEILKKYMESNPRLIRVTRNDYNLGAAKNACNLVKKAKGKYLAYCEGDDYWLDNQKLAKQIDFLEQNKDFIGCSSKCIIIDENGERVKRQNIAWVRNLEVFKPKHFQGVYLPGQTSTIVKRNIFLNNECNYNYLYEINSNVSDRTNMILYLTLGDFYIFQEPMSVYRLVHSGITSKNYTDDYLLKEIEYTDRLEKLVRENGWKQITFFLFRCELLYLAFIRLLKNKNKANVDLWIGCLRKVRMGWTVILPMIIGRIKRKLDWKRKMI